MGGRRTNIYGRGSFRAGYIGRQRQTRRSIILVVLAATAISLSGWRAVEHYFGGQGPGNGPALAAIALAAAEEASPFPEKAEARPLPEKELKRISGRMRAGEALSSILQRHGVSAQEVHVMCGALKKEIDLRRLRPGDAYVLEKEVVADSSDALEQLRAFELVITDVLGEPIRYRAKRQIGENGIPDYEVTTVAATVETVKWGLSGTIGSNLYDAVIQAGGDAALVNRFSDVFAWQIDFYSEARKNDTFKILAEKRYADGRFIGFGKVLAAEYVVNGRVLRGFRFESDDGKFIGIFDENGNSLEKTFLRSPVELARITSTYGQRFHPILKRQKKHNGVDYGAPTGTPFWSIAEGEVIEAGYSRYNGNWVRIAHRFGFVTEYLHASRLAAGLRKGQKVKQRQIVGYVGATGLASGPHLHFGMKRYDRYVNPGTQKFPSGQPVPTKQQDSFKAHIKPLIGELAQLASKSHDARVG